MYLEIAFANGGCLMDAEVFEIWLEAGRASIMRRFSPSRVIQKAEIINSYGNSPLFLRSSADTIRDPDNNSLTDGNENLSDADENCFNKQNTAKAQMELLSTSDSEEN